MNGRFYGGWWQRINSDWRTQIFINDEPTIEVDFQGLHINLLYAELGENIVGDPYDVSPIKFQWFPDQQVRTWIKRLVLTALNAKDKSSAFGAFRDGADQGGKTLMNEELDWFLDAFLTRNPTLSNFFLATKGSNSCALIVTLRPTFTATSLSEAFQCCPSMTVTSSITGA